MVEEHVIVTPWWFLTAQDYLCSTTNKQTVSSFSIDLKIGGEIVNSQDAFTHPAEDFNEC
jgi:hypothetical protein